MIQDYEKRKFIVLGIIVFFLVVICLSTCGRGCSNQRRGSGRSSSQTSDNTNRRERGGGCSRRTNNGGGNGRNEKKTVPSREPLYFNQNINVHQGVSFQETLYQKDPSAREFEQKYDVGGTKLIAEMSADVNGIYYSRNSNTEVNINILSLEQLKLHVDYSKTSVYQQIINQKIVINNSRVGFLNGPSLAEILEDFVNALVTGKMVVHLTISNITSQSVTCEIKQGQMLEIVNENVQNLVVAETRRFSIAAHQQTSLSVHVYCASRHRGDPSNSQVRFTSYLLNASSEVYESQTRVWSYIENGY